MSKGPKNRLGRLPEDIEYVDDGCEAAPACLSCPLIRCRFDSHGGLREVQAIMRRMEVKKLIAAGQSPQVIAETIPLSVRQIQRAT